MAYDLIRPIGLESPAEGGTQTSRDLTEIDPSQDALGCAGIYLTGPTASSTNKTVLVDRAAGGNLRFADQSTSRLLSELVTSVSGANNSHNAIRDIQHFLGNEGPGDGFTSGAVLIRSFSGILLTNETWFTDAAMTTKIYSRTLTYPSGNVLPSKITYAIYSASNAVLRTVVDTLTYSGLLCTQVLRTWS